MITLRDGTCSRDPRLDRVRQVDLRSLAYPVADVLTADQYRAPRSYTWSVPVVLDQGQEGACVGFGWAHELAARPGIVQGTDYPFARGVYHGAQRRDPWAGGAYPGADPFYEGTSVLAGAQEVQALGFIDEYRWAFSIPDLVTAVGYRGPAVIGVEWYQGMFAPDHDGWIRPTGQVMGGHCVCVPGVRIVRYPDAPVPANPVDAMAAVDPVASYVVIHNSWGCYDRVTEILTDSGWKFFSDLDGSETVATLNPQHEVEFHQIERMHRYAYDGDLWHYEGRDIDLMVTPNHKLYHRPKGRTDWALTPAEDIKVLNFHMKKDGKWGGAEIDTIRVAGHDIAMDLWLEFLGYFLSEGHTNLKQFERPARVRNRQGKICHENARIQTDYIVGLSQVKSETAERIQVVLDKLPFKFYHYRDSWATNNKRLYAELAPYGKASEKHLPVYFRRLSTRQATILFDALMAGDGSYAGSPTGLKVNYYTSSKRLADEMQELLLKVGYAGDITPVDRRGRVQSGGVTRHVEYRLGIKRFEVEPRRRGGWIPEKTPYVGMVYCVTVPNHVVYVRRNGRAAWSGNSGWGISGRARLSLADLAVLWPGGDFCVPVVRRSGYVPDPYPESV